MADHAASGARGDSHPRNQLRHLFHAVHSHKGQPKPFLHHPGQFPYGHGPLQGTDFSHSHRDTILFSCHLQRALRLNSQPFSCQICHTPGGNVKISMHGHITDIRLNKLYNSPANIIPVIDLF